MRGSVVISTPWLVHSLLVLQALHENNRKDFFTVLRP
jgi:hypothetical protein